MQNQQFHMGFWNYVPTGTLDERAVGDWADLGMNLAMSFSYNPDIHKPDMMLSVLDECKKRGIRVIVCDSRTSYSHYLAVGEEQFRQDLADAIRDFGNHPAVMGFHVGDEPNGEQLHAVERACILQKQLAPTLSPFVNFFPFWAASDFESITGAGNDKYGELLTNIVKNSGIEILSYDCYSQMAFHGREAGVGNYFYNLNLFRSVAQATGCTLWTSLLSVGHWNYSCPREDDFRWQISTSAAHGVTGILWFFIYERSLDSSYRVPPIDLFWERTETFEWLSRENRIFMKYYAEKFAKLELVKVYHYLKQYGGTAPFIYGQDEIIDFVTSSHEIPLIVSRFVNRETGRPAVVVVNNSQTEPTRFEIRLKKPYDAVHHSDWLAPGQLHLIEL